MLLPFHNQSASFTGRRRRWDGAAAASCSGQIWKGARKEKLPDAMIIETKKEAFIEISMYAQNSTKILKPQINLQSIIF